MGHLQTILRGVFYEALASKEVKGLTEDQRSRLKTVAALLWTKIQGPKNESVLKNQMRRLQEVMQAIADEVCWKRILDDLLTNETIPQGDRQHQVRHLEAHIVNAATALKTATAKAKEHAYGLDGIQDTEYGDNGVRDEENHTAQDGPQDQGDETKYQQDGDDNGDPEEAEAKTCRRPRCQKKRKAKARKTIRATAR